MSQNEIMVSVLCTTYNHEKYVRKCLDSFIMQKTNFKFEVIVHDDASTDGTAVIIKEYEEKYPEIIKPIYQSENQYSKGFSRIYKDFLLANAKGKYVAICEGDDYFTDPYKLQKQFDALESHPECKMCVAKVRAVDEDEKPLEKVYPEVPLPTQSLSADDFLKIACKKYSFQTTSYFMTREDYFNMEHNPPEFAKNYIVGDYTMQLYFSTVGNIYYIDEEMSAYRVNSENGFSDEIHKGDILKQMDFYGKMTSLMDKFDKCTGYKYHKYCQTFCFYEYYYYCLKCKGMYKQALSKKYKKYRKLETKKDRVAMWLYAYAPFVMKLLKK